MKKVFSIRVENIREICLEAETLLDNWNIPKIVAGDIVLSIDEALTNIKIHGYSENINGPVTIEIHKNQSKINIEIKDSAKPYALENIHAPDKLTYLGSGEIGGFGVFIIKKLMDNVKLSRINNENILWMSKET